MLQMVPLLLSGWGSSSLDAHLIFTVGLAVDCLSKNFLVDELGAFPEGAPSSMTL